MTAQPDRRDVVFPQFVLRVAAVATVLAPPAMIPVPVADLAQMSQRRVQVLPELQPFVGWFQDPGELPDEMAISAITPVRAVGTFRRCDGRSLRVR
jgi:hypothetical protein